MWGWEEKATSLERGLWSTGLDRFPQAGMGTNFPACDIQLGSLQPSNGRASQRSRAAVSTNTQPRSQPGGQVCTKVARCAGPRIPSMLPTGPWTHVLQFPKVLGIRAPCSPAALRRNEGVSKGYFS